MSVPPGYVAMKVGGTHAVVRADAADAVRELLAAGTLHDMAAAHAHARPLQGRGIAYAVPLTPSLRVVVRRNRHGGLVASLRGDRFLAPTRGPRELVTALRLAALGVPTPSVVAVVRYPAGTLLERSDVATEEVAPARDLASLTAAEPALDDAATAAGMLLRALATARARHADLNIKNVLLRGAASSLEALVLDVDRVSFHRSRREVARRNWERFSRSARKWNTLHGAPFSEAWLARVEAAADA